MRFLRSGSRPPSSVLVWALTKRASPRVLFDWLFTNQIFHLLFIGTLSFVVLFTRLHQGDLAGYDEAVYAHEGREMLQTGDWWNVRLNGNFDFDKPPMFVWLEAISMAIFGVSDFAAKLPSALLGFGTILLIFFITRELTDRFWLPVLAMLVLTCSQFFMRYAMHAMTDVPFTFFFALALLFGLKGSRQPRYLLLCGVSVSLGILMRSILGIVPLSIITLHLVVTRRYSTLRSPHFIGCFLLALGLPLIWFISQYRLHGSRFVSLHFSYTLENLPAKTTHDPWLFVLGLLQYPLLLFKYYWPWLPFLIIGFVSQTKRMLRYRDRSGSFLVIWVLCVVIPFSLLKYQYLRYIMAAFPAFAILSAISLERLIPVRRRSAYFTATYLSLCLAVSVVGVLPKYRVRYEEMRNLAPVAEAASQPYQRIVLYTDGKLRSDYLHQLIWYADRHCDNLTELGEVQSRLEGDTEAVAIVDRGSFTNLTTHVGLDVDILGESLNFVCLRKKPADFVTVNEE